MKNDPSDVFSSPVNREGSADIAVVVNHSFICRRLAWHDAESGAGSEAHKGQPGESWGH